MSARSGRREGMTKNCMHRVIHKRHRRKALRTKGALSPQSLAGESAELEFAQRVRAGDVCSARVMQRPQQIRRLRTIASAWTAWPSSRARPRQGSAASSSRPRAPARGARWAAAAPAHRG